MAGRGEDAPVEAEEEIECEADVGELAFKFDKLVVAKFDAAGDKTLARLSSTAIAMSVPSEWLISNPLAIATPSTNVWSNSPASAETLATVKMF